MNSTPPEVGIEKEKSSAYGANLVWFLRELQHADKDLLSDGFIEVYGEDPAGNEGSCEVDISDLAKEAADTIELLQNELRQANSTVDQMQEILDDYEDAHPAVKAERDEALAKLAAMETKAKQLITKACCNAVEKLTELAPNQGWDSGEVVAEMYIRQLSDKPVPADKPAPRITEQDAREILLNWDSYRAGSRASGVTPSHFKKWMDDHGQPLLNKLNADRGQVPAVAVPDALQKLRLEVAEAINILAMCGDQTPVDQLGKKLAAALNASAPSHSQQSARSPQHYAIEHAEYMAVSGEQLMDYLNEIANEDDGVLVPDDRFGDYIGGLRSGVYEFRKRRDRCSSHESEQGSAV